MHIGKRIQRLMKASSVPTKKMAAHCGITPSAVSAWFATGRISKENLALAAELLKVSTDDLISGDLDNNTASVMRAQERRFFVARD